MPGGARSGRRVVRLIGGPSIPPSTDRIQVPPHRPEPGFAKLRSGRGDTLNHQSKTMTTNDFRFGPMVEDDHTIFRLYAPGKDTAELVVQGKSPIAMQKREDGFFTVQTDDPKVRATGSGSTDGNFPTSLHASRTATPAAGVSFASARSGNQHSPARGMRQSSAKCMSARQHPMAPSLR